MDELIYAFGLFFNEYINLKESGFLCKTCKRC